MRPIKIISITLVGLLISCNSKTDKKSYEHPSNSSKAEAYNCTFENGTYSATVRYYKSESNSSTTHTLDVDVENCMVTEIHLPNNKCLDGDHIFNTTIDANGIAFIDGDNGWTYQVSIHSKK